MKIGFLVDHPECRDTLAGWYLSEWPWLYDEASTPYRDFDACRHRDQPDCTLLGFVEDRLVATASLLIDDMLPFPEYSPWLASVTVDPALRGRGLGKQIVLAATNHARQIGILGLYLWTPHHREFYEKLSWRFVRDHLHENHACSILWIPLLENPVNPGNPGNSV